MSNINFKPVLSLKRENELSQIIQGDCSEESKTQAINELVEHNLITCQYFLIRTTKL